METAFAASAGGLVVICVAVFVVCDTDGPRWPEWFDLTWYIGAPVLLLAACVLAFRVWPIVSAFLIADALCILYMKVLVRISRMYAVAEEKITRPDAVVIVAFSPISAVLYNGLNLWNLYQEWSDGRTPVDGSEAEGTAGSS